MKILNIIASDIYLIRQELNMSGNDKHDWWLADKFLQEIGDEQFDDDTIYSWFIQLDENLITTKKEESWD